MLSSLGAQLIDVFILAGYDLLPLESLDKLLEKGCPVGLAGRSCWAGCHGLEQARGMPEAYWNARSVVVAPGRERVGRTVMARCRAPAPGGR